MIWGQKWARMRSFRCLLMHESAWVHIPAEMLLGASSYSASCNPLSKWKQHMTNSTQRKSLLTYLKWLDQNVPSNKRHKWHRNSDTSHVGKVIMEALQAAGFMNHVHLKYKQNIMSDKALKQQNFPYFRQSIKAAEFSLCQTKHKNSRTFLVPDKASKQQNFPYAKVASKAAKHSFYKTMHESSLCAQQGTKAA